MPKVSVIIPNYNHAQYLKQRISSVLNQTFQDLEIIILDDCSTDNSKEIIEKFRTNSTISNIIYNAVNSGSTFKQWEKGIELAKGEYIWIAESDDWCETIFLETIVPALEENRNCVVGYCQSYCILNNNRIRFQSNHFRLQDCIDGNTFIKEYAITKNSIYNASMAIWRKDAYSKISKDFKEYKFCGDWLFWIELCRQGDVLISGKVLNFFRKHENDVSGRAYRSGLNFIEEIKILNHLFQLDVITYTDYLSGLKPRYLQFKLSNKMLGKEASRKIYDLFFIKSGVKKKLQTFYFKKKVHYRLKRIIF